MSLSSAQLFCLESFLHVINCPSALLRDFSACTLLIPTLSIQGTFFSPLAGKGNSPELITARADLAQAVEGNGARQVMTGILLLTEHQLLGLL